MEKPIEPQPPQQKSHESLKCPRCASLNTKFCYYNNYSLSQPRHFCKACKRYWTRGGTLRNVPVGGACRKNKTRPPSAYVAAVNNNNNINPNPNLDHHLINNSPLFYGLLPQTPSYPRFDTRVNIVSRSVNENSGARMNNNASGLVFSSANQDPSLTFSSYMYGGGGSTSSSASAPDTIASLFASRLIDQHEQIRFSGFDQTTYDHGGKDLKKEEVRKNTMYSWNSNNFHGQNNENDHQLEAVVVSSNHPKNSILWDHDTEELGGGGWLDSPANNVIGSSVPSLI